MSEPWGPFLVRLSPTLGLSTNSDAADRVASGWLGLGACAHSIIRVRAKAPATQPGPPTSTPCNSKVVCLSLLPCESGLGRTMARLPGGFFCHGLSSAGPSILHPHLHLTQLDGVLLVRSIPRTGARNRPDCGVLKVDPGCPPFKNKLYAPYYQVGLVSGGGRKARSPRGPSVGFQHDKDKEFQGAGGFEFCDRKSGVDPGRLGHAATTGRCFSGRCRWFMVHSPRWGFRRRGSRTGALPLGSPFVEDGWDWECLNKKPDSQEARIFGEGAFGCTCVASAQFLFSGDNASPCQDHFSLSHALPMFRPTPNFFFFGLADNAMLMQQTVGGRGARVLSGPPLPSPSLSITDSDS